jgi:CO/xanthine dehydrogenase FAD-binding subunit
MLPKFTYVRPTTVNEALAVLNDRPALIHGGGTDLLGCLREGVFSADTLVSLSSIDELKGVRKAADGGLRIGALAKVAAGCQVGAATALAGTVWLIAFSMPLIYLPARLRRRLA